MSAPDGPDELMRAWENGRPANVTVGPSLVIGCPECEVPVEAIDFDFVTGVSTSQPCGHSRPQS